MVESGRGLDAFVSQLVRGPIKLASVLPLRLAEGSSSWLVSMTGVAVFVVVLLIGVFSLQDMVIDDIQIKSAGREMKGDAMGEMCGA